MALPDAGSRDDAGASLLLSGAKFAGRAERRRRVRLGRIDKGGPFWTPRWGRLDCPVILTQIAPLGTVLPRPIRSPPPVTRDFTEPVKIFLHFPFRRENTGNFFNSARSAAKYFVLNQRLVEKILVAAKRGK